MLGVTFLLTIFRDLTEAIVVGFALGSVLVIHRMSRTTDVKADSAFVGRDEADTAHPRGAYDENEAQNPDVVIYRIVGALFFGATASIGSVLDRIQDTHKALIVDFSSVPFLDSTGANMIEGLAHKARKRGVAIWLTGASREIQRVFATHGLKSPVVHYATTVDEAIAEMCDAATNEREAT
ncbi:putative transporter (plasmid) [Roseovarius indicus]|uniref:Putative transporter n=1 Tax=Roseovarius indicus TaxID=540747 RepID=A0A5P3ALI9_9RHOB|nr:putative transporter [Roseovarius indicus]SFE47403.1 anti-anti-sigma factor [Roseovarius indicus]